MCLKSARTPRAHPSIASNGLWRRRVAGEDVELKSRRRINRRSTRSAFLASARRQRAGKVTTQPW